MRRASVGSTIIAAMLLSLLAGDAHSQENGGPYVIQIRDDSITLIEPGFESDVDAQPASFMQPQPLLMPRLEAEPSVRLPSVVLSSSLFDPRRGRPGTELDARLRQIQTPGSSLIIGLEAAPRAATDAGSLLRKSPAAVGVRTQQRTPVVNDPRIRGSRVGELAASGSHWVPARIDLDTAVNKFDSRIVENILTIDGPYSVLYGPNRHFIDVAFYDSPRYGESFESFGSSSIEFQSNGEQFHGRQMLWGGDDQWGYRFGYSHRTGNNYTTGAGTEVPASYNSREFDLALGHELTPDSRMEFHYLRLDQTDVEFPGQAFDIDFLKTDGFELAYTLRDQPYYDLLSMEVWYNRTVFAGSAQNAGKRLQFPFYDFISFIGNTDVDSMSLGYQIALTWGDLECTHLTAGVDLRYLKQELNEITSGRLGFTIWDDANSPIPRSDSLDQGFFATLTSPVNEQLRVEAGVRADVVSANVIDDPAKLTALGIQQPQSSLADILGTGDFDQSFTPWLAFVTGEYQLTDVLTLQGGVGYAQRPPSLTELYAAEPFMFLLQNGLNTVTGDPRLEAERTHQLDIGLRYDNDRLRVGVRGFHSWVNDYITFENMRVVLGPPFGQPEQVNLKYVNTDLATFLGGELIVEHDTTAWLTPFATVAYVEGTDRSRNGNFATLQASPGNPSLRDPGMVRGAFSGITGNDVEPLPGISPLEARVGLRFHEGVPRPTWATELSARMVDGQDRVAASLLESTTPGFTVFDIRGYWQPRENMTFIAGVENLTDRAYREHLDFRSQSGIQVLQPGANFYSSFELTY